MYNSHLELLLIIWFACHFHKFWFLYQKHTVMETTRSHARSFVLSCDTKCHFTEYTNVNLGSNTAIDQKFTRWLPKDARTTVSKVWILSSQYLRRYFTHCWELLEEFRRVQLSRKTCLSFFNWSSVHTWNRITRKQCLTNVFIQSFERTRKQQWASIECHQILPN